MTNRTEYHNTIVRLQRDKSIKRIHSYATNDARLCIDVATATKSYTYNFTLGGYLIDVYER